MLFDKFFKKNEALKTESINPYAPTSGRKWGYILPEGPHCELTAFAENVIKAQNTLIVGTYNTECLLDSIVQAIVCKYSPDTAALFLLDTRRDLFTYSKFPHVESYKLIIRQSTEEIDHLYQFIDDRLCYMQNHHMCIWEGKPLFVIINNYTDLFYYGDKQINQKMFHILSRTRIAGMHLIAATNGISDYYNISTEAISPFTVRVATSISEYESKRLFGTPKFSFEHMLSDKYAVKGELESIGQMKLYDFPCSTEDNIDWLLSYWKSENCKRI